MKDDVFVFGSNLAGIHGAGAAMAARMFHGAIPRQGRGRTGMAYAIPTKDARLETLPLSVIAEAVEEFVQYAIAHPEERFYLTRIGCGLAGYTDADIAPLFQGCPPHVIMPQGWRGLIGQEEGVAHG